MESVRSTPSWLSRRGGRGRHGAQPRRPARRARCATYLDHLVVERGLAENSVKSYRRDLRRYLGYLDRVGVTTLDEVTEQTVSGFLMALREGDADHQPLSATSAGRTVVAVRGFHKFAVAGRAGARSTRRPAYALRRRPSGCPRRSRWATSSGCSRRPAPPGPRWRCATGRCSRCSTAPAPGSPRRSGSTSTTWSWTRGPGRAAAVLLRGKGSQGADRAGRQLRARGGPGLPRPRPARAARRAADRRAATERAGAMFLNARGGRLSRQSAWAVIVQGRRAGRAHRRGVAAHAAALLRHPPARGRRRRPRGAGAARPRLGDHDAGLHAGDRRQPARGVRRGAPARPRADAGLCTGPATKCASTAGRYTHLPQIWMMWGMGSHSACDPLRTAIESRPRLGGKSTDDVDRPGQRSCTRGRHHER